MKDWPARIQVVRRHLAVMLSVNWVYSYNPPQKPTYRNKCMRAPRTSDLSVHSLYWCISRCADYGTCASFLLPHGTACARGYGLDYVQNANLTHAVIACHASLSLYDKPHMTLNDNRSQMTMTSEQDVAWCWRFLLSLILYWNVSSCWEHLTMHFALKLKHMFIVPLSVCLSDCLCMYVA